MKSSSEEVTLNDIVITASLRERAQRQPDHSAENAALAALAQTLAHSPHEIAKCLADAALALTGADSSGLSVEESVNGERVFRWVATAGKLTGYLNNTMPRDFSPCGSVVDADAPMLMRQPVRFFPYIDGLDFPVHEALLVPFRSKTTPIGTLWVVSHSGAKLFDAEDLRVIESLSFFAAAAAQTVSSLEALEEADRQKDNFLVTLAHELRNPLAPIGQAAVIAASSRATEEQRRLSQSVIERQVHTMALILDDLLDASRISRSRLELRKESIDLVSVLEAAVETVRPLIDGKQLNLSIESRPSRIQLSGDPLRLGQIPSPRRDDR